MLSCLRSNPSDEHSELKCREMEKLSKDANTPEERLRRRKIRKLRNGQPQINFSDGDGGTWKTVAPNPWPPHNLNIKSFVLTGIGATNIQCAKASGGYGLPNPSPLMLKFELGWDTHLHKMIEHYKDREPVSGVLYYVAGNGKAVGKLTFENAAVASIRWPKFDRTKPKAEKAAFITVILQPSSSTVERIEKVKDAPAAPVADTDKLHDVTHRDFKVEFEGINSTDAVSGVKLPSIVMNLKREISFGYDETTKRQKRSVNYKVTGVKHKHLHIRIRRGGGATKVWRDWLKERPARPRIGSVEVTQSAQGGTSNGNNGGGDDAAGGERQLLYTYKFFGLYPNRIVNKKDFADVVFGFDSMTIEHHDPE